MLVIEIQDLLLHCIVIGIVHVNLGFLTNDVPEFFDRAHQEVLGFVWDIQDILDPLSFIGVEVEVLFLEDRVLILLVWGLIRGKKLLEVGVPDLLSLLLNGQRSVLQDFIDELSEKLSLQLDQALCLQVFPLLPREVILLPPRVKVDLNEGRVDT